MPTNIVLGELEQLVLLVILRLEDRAYALNIREQLRTLAGKSITRGALYRTYDRLHRKGFLRWVQETEAPKRGGHPRRRFEVTAHGMQAVRASRNLLTSLWSGLELDPSK